MVSHAGYRLHGLHAEVYTLQKSFTNGAIILVRFVSDGMTNFNANVDFDVHLMVV